MRVHFGDRVLSQNDPTDHALAAIASILDLAQSDVDIEKPATEEKAAVSEVDHADGYTKFGPGPVAAMRFKWTVRRESSNDYFVDETVGEGSRPIISGPMSKEAAIRFVDEHNDEARRRFDLIKHEMTGIRKEVPDPDTSNLM
jgi:hypothetical protein